MKIIWFDNKNIGYWNIKPENILIFQENIKLIDYGINFWIMK